MRRSVYSKKFIRGFIFLFFLFSVVTVIILYNREKNKNIDIVRSKSEVYSEVISNYLIHNLKIDSTRFTELDSLISTYFESDLRVTIISLTGKVIYDNHVDGFDKMEDHSSRTEIVEAGNLGTGSDLRLSASTDIEYFYYAVKKDNLYIRTALPLNAHLNDILNVDNAFIIFLLITFFILLIILFNISDHFGSSVNLLRKFSVAIATGSDLTENIEFGKNELGEISGQIKKVYLNSKRTQEKLNIEKEKFIQHLSFAKEGIGIFSADGELILYNNNFVNYMNILSGVKLNEKIVDFSTCRTIEEYSQFLTALIPGKYDIKGSTLNSVIKKDGSFFEFHLILFIDNGFEIIINDITEPEKRKIFKQQISSNISHELKTPVSAVSGFLETILENPDIPEDKKNDFLKRSFEQIKRLNILINDISILNKIDEAGSLFNKEKINLYDLIKDIVTQMEFSLSENNITIELKNLENIYIAGNEHLLDSVFRNLIDNSIKYAGKGTRIIIEKFFEDENFININFLDNGRGVPLEHLPRLFERFYRIDNGRSRALGGTGLGLSIVKNAIQFHGGDIYAEKIEKGIKFSFSLKKK